MTTLTALRSLAITAAAIVSFESVTTLATARGWSATSAIALPLAVDIGLLVAIRSRSLWLTLPAIAINASANLIAHASDAVSAFLSLIPVCVLLIAEIAPYARPERAPEATPAPLSAPTTIVPPEAFREALRAASGQPAADKPKAPRTPASATASVMVGHTARLAREAYAVLATDGQPVTADRMAAHLGLSVRSGRRYLAMATAKD